MTFMRKEIWVRSFFVTFMRKDRVFEDRVGEIRVKGDLGQALHSENIFFLSS